MFVPKGLINNIPALVLIIARRQPGDKPLSEPMMVSLWTHICVTRPQWIKLTTKTYRSILVDSLHKGQLCDGVSLSWRHYSMIWFTQRLAPFETRHTRWYGAKTCVQSRLRQVCVLKFRVKRMTEIPPTASESCWEYWYMLLLFHWFVSTMAYTYWANMYCLDSKYALWILHLFSGILNDTSEHQIICIALWNRFWFTESPFTSTFEDINMYGTWTWCSIILYVFL